jgi:hypothetical protein
MNLREYQRLKTEAEAEYRRKLEAIEMVWKLSGGDSKNGSSPHETSIGKGSLQQAIRYAIPYLTGEFTLREVEQQMKVHDPVFAAKVKRPSISGALKRMADDKEIVVVAAGSGKRASKYRKAG